MKTKESVTKLTPMQDIQAWLKLVQLGAFSTDKNPQTASQVRMALKA